MEENEAILNEAQEEFNQKTETLKEVKRDLREW